VLLVGDVRERRVEAAAQVIPVGAGRIEDAEVEEWQGHAGPRNRDAVQAIQAATREPLRHELPGLDEARDGFLYECGL